MRKQCKKTGGESMLQQIPKLASMVGGDTDILIGSKYLRYHPQEIWKSKDNGISVSDSLFLSVDGTTGVINGPHPRFSDIEQQHWLEQANTCEGQSTSKTHFSYYEKSVIDYREAYKVATNISLLGGKCDFEFDVTNTCGIRQKHDLGYDRSTLVAKRPPTCV